MEREKKERRMKIIITSIIGASAIIFIFCIIAIFMLQAQKPKTQIDDPLPNVNTNKQVQNEVTGTNTQNNNEQAGTIIPDLEDVPGSISSEINQTKWNLISQTHYYSQLNGNAKMIYDGLAKNKDRLLTGNYKIDFGTQFNTLLHTKEGEEQLGKDFQSAWNAFYYDDASLFYMDTEKVTLLKEAETVGEITTYKVSIGPGNNENYWKEEFKTKEQIQEAQKYIQNIVNQISEQTKENTDAIKARKIHDWLVSVVEYDSLETSKNRFHIYGTLYEGKAVCEGYARTFKYLMEQVGVPCILVTGTATNSQGQTEAHAWNYIQINSQWYAVDVTWDDPVIVGGGTPSPDTKYRYFLKGSETFFKDHKENGEISKNSMRFTYPTLSMVDQVL